MASDRFEFRLMIGEGRSIEGLAGISNQGALEAYIDPTDPVNKDLPLLVGIVENCDIKNVVMKIKVEPARSWIELSEKVKGILREATYERHICRNPGCDRTSPGSALYCCSSCEISATNANGPWDIEPYSLDNDGSYAYRLHHHVPGCKANEAECSDNIRITCLQADTCLAGFECPTFKNRKKKGLEPTADTIGMSMHFSDTDPVAVCLVQECKMRFHGDSRNDAMSAWSKHVSEKHREDWGDD